MKIAKNWGLVGLLAMLTLFLAQVGHAQPARAPVPSEQQQKAGAKVLDEGFGVSKAVGATKKQQLVKDLKAAASDPNLSKDDLYVVLTTVISLTQELRDLRAMTAAVEQLVTAFDVVASAERTRHLVRYLEGASVKTALALKPVYDEVTNLARSAAAENRYRDAVALLDAVETTLKKMSVAGSSRQTLTDLRKEIIAKKEKFEAFQLARSVLESKPEDPDSNFTVGRWLVTEENVWKLALPHLEKSSKSKPWQTAAALELAPNAEPVAVGDQWWDLAQSESGSTKTALLVHAGEWYTRALPKLSLLPKKRAEGRLSEIAALPKVGEVPVSPSRPVNSTVAQATPPARPGEWIDLLEWAEGVDWAPRGINWNENIEGKPTKNGISLKQKEFSRVPLPAIVDGDYEMECEFTRTNGVSQIVVFFPIGIHNLQLFLGYPVNGNWSGLNWIDGKGYDQNGTARPSLITSNKRHRLQIRVHHDGDKAKINIDLDDVKDYLNWSGPYASLTNVCDNNWTESMVRHPWIGSWQSNVTFHSVKLRMLSGTIRRDVITDADREQDLKNGFVRLVGEKAIAPKVDYAQFLVNQIPLGEGPGSTERLWPLITRDFKVCDDFYGAHAPSRLKCPIPTGAKSFSVVGHNEGSRAAKYVVLIDGKQVYDSGVTDVAIIKVDLPAKSSLLELVADPAGSNVDDQVYWCWPRFHSVAVEKVPDKLLDGKPGLLKFAIASHTVGTQKLTHNEPINTLKSVPVHYRDAQPCDEFLFAVAPSTVTYQVPEGMTHFTTIGYNVRSHSVKFEVWADAKRIYESPQAGIIPVDVKLPPGTKTIELKVNSLGNGWGDYSMWCYPRLHRK